MAELTKQDIQTMLDAQSERFEHRTKEIVTEVVTEVVNDAIEQVVMPVLNDIMTVQADHTERLERIEGPHKQQEARLDDHDRRIVVLEAKA